MFNYNQNEQMQEVFHKTSVLRRPITGFVAGYHELPYIFIAPDDENESNSLEINGKINVSPRLVLSPSMFGESYGDIFDPETFDKEINARLFSFYYIKKRNVKIESASFTVSNHEERAIDRANRVHDELQMQENVRTGLILGPRFQFYPVSLDRFINEIIDREFSG